jgi:hypothetical protein
MSVEPGTGTTTGSRRWLRPAGLAIGACLLAAAVITVAREHETIGGALQAVRQPSPGMVLLLVAAVAANVILAGLTFSVLMSRYGRVGVLEMQALIAAAALLNFLPLRPGLFGRIAYHKTCNHIRALDSVKTVVQAAGLSMAVAGYMALALVVAGRWAVPLWALVGLPVPLLAVAAAFRRPRVWAAAGLVRYLEITVWALRYHAAFALLGSPLEADGALAFACVSSVTMLVPFVGNGLGLREWGIGLAAPLLTPYALELGLAAELVNRAAELVVILVMGLGGIAWLAARTRASAGGDP